MKSCSETIKACGLKSTKQVADLNDVTPRTVQLAFKNDPERFKAMIFISIEVFYDAQKHSVQATALGELFTHKEIIEISKKVCHTW